MIAVASRRALADRGRSAGRSDHGGDDLVLDEVPDGGGHHDDAVAQDRDGVAHFVDLLEVMGDVEERHAVGLQPSHVLEESGDLGRLEAGGGFVEDDEPRTQPQCPGDLDELALAHAELGGRSVDVDVDVPLLEQLAGLRRERLPADQRADCRGAS